jgi:hypothetical protein
MFSTGIFLRNEDCEGGSAYIQENRVGLYDRKTENPQKVTWIGIPVPSIL